MMLHYATPPAEPTAAPEVPIDLDLAPYGNPTGPQTQYCMDGRVDLIVSITRIDDRYDVEVAHCWVGGRHGGRQRPILHCTDITPAELGDCLRRAHTYVARPAEEE